MQVLEICEQFAGGVEGDPGLVRQARQSSWDGLPTGEGQIYQGYPKLTKEHSCYVRIDHQVKYNYIKL